MLDHDENVHSLVCATPQTSEPAPQGAPEPDDGLGLPASLDRTGGRSYQEIASETAALLGQDRNEDGSRKLANPPSRKEARKRKQPAARPAKEPKAKEKSKAMPLTGKAAVEAIRGKKAKDPAEPKVTVTESKLDMIVRMLKSAEGCTTAEVLAATKWPSVSMPQQARAAGLELLKEKDGSVTRYRAKAS